MSNNKKSSENTNLSKFEISTVRNTKQENQIDKTRLWNTENETTDTTENNSSNTD